jgi:restriction system protein
MSRYYRRSRRSDYESDDTGKFISGVVVFFIVMLVLAYNAGPWAFIATLASEIGLIVLVIWGIKAIKKNKENAKKAKVENILKTIQEAGLEEYINNFILRFGLGQEKSENVWTRRNYKISWDRINDLKNILYQKKIDFSPQEICILLANYIDKREFDLTANSISSTTNSFSKLSGSDFERLLYRLYEALGYSVQMTGKTGDQGGDLIATKGQERLLVQAKCYKDWSVGNKAIQEAAAARVHYNCNKAAVIITSMFTREATELAKTNLVDLISKELLQKMLLDNLKENWG